MGQVEEFVCIWFDRYQKWVVMFENGHIIDNDFQAIGYAVNSALSTLDRGECEFECVEDTGCFQRWVKDDEFWSSH